MSFGYDWNLNQVHTIPFVLVDSNNTEVEGLGNTFVVQLRKSGGSFQASAGTKAEISDGWYTYTNTAGEADTPGPVAIMITGAGIVRQNLVAIVKTLQLSAVDFTYTLTNSSNGNPIGGVEVTFTTDEAGSDIVWQGETDDFGVARDPYGNLPTLDPGTYYIFRQKAGYHFQDPDIEVVS